MRWLVQLAVLCLLAGTGGARPRVADGRGPAELRHAEREQAVVAARGDAARLLVRRGGERVPSDARRDGVGPALAAGQAALSPPARRIILLAWAAARGHACDAVRDVRARGPPIG